jgi:hypothetical protein
MISKHAPISDVFFMKWTFCIIAACGSGRPVTAC